MNGHEMELDGPYLGRLRSSSPTEDARELAERMAEDGYLWLLGAIDPDKVLRARRHLLERLSGEGQLRPGTPAEEARMGERPGGRFWGGDKELTHCESVLGVYESPELFDFFQRFLGEAPRRTTTSGFGWSPAARRRQSAMPLAGPTRAARIESEVVVERAARRTEADEEEVPTRV